MLKKNSLHEKNSFSTALRYLRRNQPEQVWIPFNNINLNYLCVYIKKKFIIKNVI